MTFSLDTFLLASRVLSCIFKKSELPPEFCWMCSATVAPRASASSSSAALSALAPNWLRMSSPQTTSPASTKRASQLGSLAMGTGMQLAKQTPASRHVSAHHAVASAEPTGR